MAGSPLGGFAPGERIAGYVLEEQIGRGGMAVVFRAHDERLDRTVALKILAPGLADDEAFRQRFIRESRAAAAVDDPHIIPVFDAGEVSGVLFIAMRYVSGGDVATAAQHAGLLELGEVAGIVSQVASALDAAHARGLVHRDVKPTNMLLDAGRSSGRPDHVYLSDFGLSKPQMTAAKITATGQFLGTLDYVSPEQVAGQAVGAASDQYSLACAAFELLSGTAPFERDTGLAVMYAHLHDAPPSLLDRRPELPAKVEAVFAKALAKAPADRYASCQEFAEAMRAALGLHPYRSQSETDRQRTAIEPVDAVAHDYPETIAASSAAGAAPTDAQARPAPTEQVSSERVSAEPVSAEPVSAEPSTVFRSIGSSGTGSGRRWWRSRVAIAAAVAVVVLLGGGAALLLNGGNTNLPSGAVIFMADFTFGTDGWQVPQNSAASHTANGSYYIDAANSDSYEIGVPASVSNLYPSAPADIRIDVSARRSKGPANYVQYGLVCRDSSGSYYAFEVQGKQVTIGKFSRAGFVVLASAPADAVRVGAPNQLSAICQSVAGQHAVQLSFAVNGTRLLSTTDRSNPLGNGTVGMFAGFYFNLPAGVQATFQDFVVRRL